MSFMTNRGDEQQESKHHPDCGGRSPLGWPMCCGTVKDIQDFYDDSFGDYDPAADYNDAEQEEE
jgi:hypothetical protein